ncbi:hypothetical protein [Endozoicomonas sp. Mp262]|uniref:hypothetical protein n=1 Tax=Endozoicomonas sp. Mp262 TaxID=2919499 RepID=UPI0021D9AA88
MFKHLLPMPPGPNSGKRFFWFSGRAEIALALVVMVTGLKLYVDGTGHRVMVLFLGSALSAIILYGLSHPNSKVRQKLEKWLVSPFSHIPYIFGLYLFFFEGFWRLAKMLDGFSYFELAQAAFFFIGGNMVVSAGYMATEYVHSLKESRQLSH